MPARRIAVLVGSHDPAHFTPHRPPDRPSEAAVLTALRAQRPKREAGHRASAPRIAPHAGARAAAGEQSGPVRINVFAAAARTRRPVRQLHMRTLAGRTAGG